MHSYLKKNMNLNRGYLWAYLNSKHVKEIMVMGNINGGYKYIILSDKPMKLEFLCLIFGGVFTLIWPAVAYYCFCPHPPPAAQHLIHGFWFLLFPHTPSPSPQKAQFLLINFSSFLCFLVFPTWLVCVGSSGVRRVGMRKGVAWTWKLYHLNVFLLLLLLCEYFFCFFLLISC